MEGIILEHQNNFVEEIEVDVFYSGERLADFIQQEHDFDLIFLDIDMEGLNGLDLGRKMRCLKMKKQYYLDLVLLIIILGLSVYLLGQVNNPVYTIILISFAVIFSYINLRFRIIFKYPYEGKLSIGNYLGYFEILLGKLLYIIGLFNLTITNSDKPYNFIIYGFIPVIWYLSMFHNTAYIYNNYLIYNFSRVIDIQEIDRYEMKKKTLDTYFLIVHMKNKEVFKLGLNDSNYYKLQLLIE